VAIGVAAALNCHNCLRRLIPASLNNGILAEEVSAALAVAEEVRSHAGGMTDGLSASLVKRGETRQTGAEHDTKCC
jgi:hypothetical protein